MARLGAWMGFAIALWTPLAAAATAGMCVEPTLERLAEASEDLAPGPATAPATPGATPQPAPFEGDGEVPWCANPDDPRCAPLPAAPEPSRVEGRTPINAVSAGLEHDRWPSGQARATARHGLARAAGVTTRLERPPRRHGRVRG